jgi:NAD(P)H-dependent flavin oxidoreductase YrpB (nitropropane dioxygenase family)
MNMIGAPKHVPKALECGVDIICAQGGEGGGHTGDIATSLLLPKVVDLCNKHTSPYTGRPVAVVGAGGIYDGRGLAMALSYGCQAVWVGTRFVASEEAGASLQHKEAIVKADYTDTFRTLVYTGRPMRIIKNWYAEDWHDNRRDELQRLLDKGVIPYTADAQKATESMRETKGSDSQLDYVQQYNDAVPLLAGQVVGAIDEIKPAAAIVEDMMSQAIEVLKKNAKLVVPLSKL